MPWDLLDAITGAARENSNLCLDFQQFHNTWVVQIFPTKIADASTTWVNPSGST
jgi:hypothetical protein